MGSSDRHASSTRVSYSVSSLVRDESVFVVVCICVYAPCLIVSHVSVGESPGGFGVCLPV